MRDRLNLHRVLTERLPTWLLANPFEVAMLSIAFLRSVLYISHVTPASVAEQSLPQPLLYVLLGFYGTAALFSLVNLGRDNLALERVGLIIVGPFALAYGIVLVSTEPVKGLYSFLLYLLIAWACLIRGSVIPKLLRIRRAAGVVQR